MSLSIAIKAQTISGTVYSIDSSGTRTLLSGAGIGFKGTNNVTTTDIKGEFSIKKNNNHNPVFLMITNVGYSKDSILIKDSIDYSGLEFFLREEKMQLNEVSVTAIQPGTSLSRNSTLTMEKISKTCLIKMACCNLAGSFQNSATITVGYSDAISGAKQVQLLGLS
jgi:hypothetical protein